MKTTLILLPGLDGTGVLFDRFVEALPDDIDPIVIRYPGDVDLSYDELLTLIEAQLPAERPFVVLGESFSGPLALRLATRNPNVTAVILCASFVTNPLRYVPSQAAFLAMPFLFRFFPAFARVKTLLGGYATTALTASLREAHELVAPHVIASRARNILRLDVTRALRDSHTPLMYLGGAGDGVVRRHNFELVRRIRPDVEVELLPAPHLVLQTAPESAASAVSRFISRLSGSN
jgi:pimeloyl-[acyl-carrier protein] methyl ester esterase